MATEIQIYHAAAAAIGSGTRVTSPDDDTTMARSIKGVWDLERRAAIRDGAWNFATRRDALPALTETPAFEFEFAYRLPADCLRLIDVRGVAREHYQLEAGRILCNSSGPLHIRCLVDVPEPAEWDDQFARAFALRIAMAIGTKIAGSSFDKSKVSALYQQALRDAQGVDALENPRIEMEESDWIAARHVGVSWQNPAWLDR